MPSVLDNLKLIRDYPNDFAGKKVLVRLDLNVLVKGDLVADDFRIKKVLPTIEFLKSQKAKVIILGHIGRHKNDSLKPVFEYLKKIFDISFIPGFRNDIALPIIDTMGDGQIVMFENLRAGDGDEEETNDSRFAKHLAGFGDIFVSDAFAVSHREHSSIVSLPKLLPSYVGILFEEEIKHLEVAFHPPHPFFFILGGAKFETKLPLIKKYLELADYCFVGGALAHNFFRKKGYELGESLTDDTFNIGELLNNKKLILPIDVMVSGASGVLVKTPDKILPDDKMLDAGPKTLVKLKELIDKSKFVLWNGPIGDYTKDGFEKGTEGLIKILANKKFAPGGLVVGGGDTASIISQMNMEDNFEFISTGGGAMLEFLSKGTLPGIEALKN